MYELIRHSLVSRLLPQQILSGGVAFIIANQYYRFHSFGLELISFLITWGVFDFITQKLMDLLRGRKNRR